MTYDAKDVAKTALEIQMGIQDIILDDDDVQDYVDDHVFIDDVRDDLTSTDDPEAGNIVKHETYPIVRITYIDRGKGKITASGFEDVGFNFIVRVHSEKPQSNAGKKEVREITELIINLLKNNFRLNDTCWHSEWEMADNKTTYGSLVSKEDDTVVYERLGEIQGTAYALIPTNYN